MFNTANQTTDNPVHSHDLATSNVTTGHMSARRARGMLAILLCAASILSGTAAPPASALQRDTAVNVTLPSGFVSEPFATGLRAPRAFTWTPDGRMLILERGSSDSADINFASVRVIKNGALLPTRAITLNVCGDGERGALGIAVDPNFATNSYIYIYYTRQTNAPSPAPTCEYGTYGANPPRPGPRNRVSRFTMNGDVVLAGSEKMVIDGIASDVGVHNAGNLAFGKDGYLYISTGDGGIPTLSQAASTLNGKILRVKPDNSTTGYATTGNPYDSAPGARYCSNVVPDSSSNPCREVYALGLRNPFRFTVNSANGDIFIGDVGGGSWEEINMLSAGGNYGYPYVEGMCNCSTYIEPTYTYSHVVQYANVDSAISAISHYSSTAYPQMYANSLFYADFVRPWMNRLYFNTVSSTWVNEPFMTGLTGIIDLKQGPDGNLYYLAFADDNGTTNYVSRIRYTGGLNRAPTAAIAATPLFPALNAAVTYSGTASYDPDDDALIYKWTFGNGSVISSTSASIVTMTYAVTGPQVVTLTVIDLGSPPLESAPESITIYPGGVPATADILVTNITAPNRDKFYGGDTWVFTATNISAPIGLAPDPYNWSVVFHHRDHTHPFLSGMPGLSGQFILPRTGETDTVVWYRVTLRLKDAQGATNIVTRDIHPITTTIGLNTSPAGGAILVNGHPFVTPASILRVAGMQDLLDVETQWIGSSLYRFTNWSIGGPKSQWFTAPGTPVALTATLELTSSMQVYLPVLLAPGQN